MLADESARDPVKMTAALLQLTQQAPPSAVVVPGLLDGMPNVNKLARKWLDGGRHPRFGSRVRRNA